MSPGRSAAALMVAAVGAAACAGNGDEALPDGAVEVIGTVALTGTAEAPFVTLREGEGGWLLRGDALDELARLDGAVVRVTGWPGARGEGDAGPRTLEVASYGVESVLGETPTVGTVALDADGRAVLDTDGGRLLLAGSPSLARREGARVWVVGQRAGSTLTVASYGIIRPAG